MAFIVGPVDGSCCDDPCAAARDDPCDPCEDCECPEAWEDCIRCPHDALAGYYETLACSLTEDVANWTFDGINWDIGPAPACLFSGESEQDEPCEVLIIIKWSASYGWWAQTSGTCVDTRHYWGDPQLGCNDALQGSTLYENGDGDADFWIDVT